MVPRYANGTEKRKISMKIEECGSNNKKLFLLVNHLTGHKPEIPLPTRRSDKELTEELASFFLSKIVKIREELDHQPLYHPSKSDIPEFNNCRKLEDDQVRKLVMTTKCTSCELDPIPNTLLKTSYHHLAIGATFPYLHAYFFSFL